MAEEVAANPPAPVVPAAGDAPLLAPQAGQLIAKFSDLSNELLRATAAVLTVQSTGARDAVEQRMSDLIVGRHPAGFYGPDSP